MTLTDRFDSWGWRVTALLLAAGAGAITLPSIGYFGDGMPPFVIEKLPLPHEAIWLKALKVHVAAAVFCLPACLFLVSSTALRRLGRAHRWIGRVAGTVTVLALVPSGTYLALYAKGGILSTLGFILSGVIVTAATILGVAAARRRKFVEHRRCMLHVLAQMSVAVTSRAMLFAFDAVAADEHIAYLVSLWLPVIGSFLVVEGMFPRRQGRASQCTPARQSPPRSVAHSASL